MALSKSDLKAIKTIVDEREFSDRDIKAIKQIVDEKKFRLADEDFDRIKELMNLTIEERTEDLLVTKEQISHLPTKDQFYEKENEVIKELQAVREEIGVLSGLQTKVNDHDRKIEKIQEKLGLQTI